jgi:hypothetical protein
MRHESISITDRVEFGDVAAVWPISVQVAPVPIPDVEPHGVEPPFMPTPAAPDIPAGVGGLIVAAYVALIATFAAATIRSADSAFVLAIVAFFVGMFFAVPRLFFGIEPKAGPRIGLDRFMHDGIETFTGHCSGRAALVQMLIVPLFLTLGVAAMGIAIAIIL